MRDLSRIKLEYKKINISETKKAKHEVRLSKLKELVPYGSIIRGEFEPVLGRIRGQLVVKSKRHQFTSLTLETDIDSCFNALAKDMNQQILNWKKGRFSGTPTPAQVAMA